MSMPHLATLLGSIWLAQLLTLSVVSAREADTAFEAPRARQDSGRQLRSMADLDLEFLEYLVRQNSTSRYYDALEDVSRIELNETRTLPITGLNVGLGASPEWDNFTMNTFGASVDVMDLLTYPSRTRRAARLHDSTMEERAQEINQLLYELRLAYSTALSLERALEDRMKRLEQIRATRELAEKQFLNQKIELSDFMQSTEMEFQAQEALRETELDLVHGRLEVERLIEMKLDQAVAAQQDWRERTQRPDDR